ncbi:MAG TPA: hypothetical protein VIO94_15455 [Phenylobacterium sp.]
MLRLLDGLNGSIPIDKALDNETVLARVEDLLRREGRSVADRGSDLVTFKDPFWREYSAPAKWPVFAMYNEGRFQIETTPEGRCLRYDVRRPGAFLFCLCAACVFFVFGFAGGGLNRGVLYSVFALSFLYGVNTCLALVRAPAAIRKAIRSEVA